MASYNICLGSDCEAIVTDGAVYCAACDRTDHAARIARMDVFQRATSGFHTLTHAAWNIARLGTGVTTEPDWSAFEEWNPDVIRFLIPSLRVRCTNTLLSR